MSDITRLSLPLSLWIAAFSAVYGLQGVVCSDLWTGLGLTPGHGRAALIAAWAIAVGLQLALLAALRKPRLASDLPWVQRVSTILAVVALAATVWTLMPVAAASLCL